MIKEKDMLYDGMMEAPLGVNSGASPSTLPPGQVSFAINTTFRGDFPQQRPGWFQRTLSFVDDDAQSDFEDGMFQDASYYEAFSDDDSVVVMVAGRVFRILLRDNTVLDLTPPKADATDDINIPTIQKMWMRQGEEFLVMQNGIDAALIYDGAIVRRSGKDEMPTGSVMSYALGRFWVASSDGRAFIASDLVGDSTVGTEKYAFRDSILKFTENTYLNEGGAFGVPQQAGIITAMEPIANLDTSLGQGPLQVFTERGSFSVNAPFDRTTWKDLQSPIQTVSSVCYGPKSASSVVPVNGDIWYRAEDGLRTFQVARRDFNSWVNTPMSHEVERVTSNDDKALLKFGSGVVFDNRLLVTSAPQFDGTYGVYHLGLIALCFDNVSTINERQPPGYDGLWTGLRIHKIVKGNQGGQERCLMFVRNPDSNALELWELSLGDPYDEDDKKISWVVEYPSLKFGTPGDLKSLEGASLWIDQAYGPVTLVLKYRPDQYPAWQDWHTTTACAKMENCADVACGDMLNLQRQHRSRLMIPTPPNVCDETNGLPMRFAYEFQTRFEIEGPCRLMKYRMQARKQLELPGGCS